MRLDEVRGARRDPGLVVLEGFHAIKHAVRFGAELLGVWTADADELAALSARLAPDVVLDADRRRTSTRWRRSSRARRSSRSRGARASSTRTGSWRRTARPR